MEDSETIVMQNFFDPQPIFISSHIPSTKKRHFNKVYTVLGLKISILHVASD